MRWSIFAVLIAWGTFLPCLAQAAPMSEGGDLHLRGIDHVGMNVPNTDEAVRFFAELLGTRVVLDIRPAQVGLEWKRRFNWHASSKIDRIVMLRTASGDGIELLQYHGPAASKARPHEDDVGATHIALRIRDMDAALLVLRQHGLRVLNEPMTTPDGMRWLYFLTPWNAKLELVVPSIPQP